MPPPAPSQAAPEVVESLPDPELAPPPGGGSADASLPPRAAALAPPHPLTPSPHPAPRARLGVLRHRHYRNVWCGALVSSVGGWMEILGVQWLMAEQTSSAVMMGYLAAAQLFPMLLLGVWGGLVADRVNRKRLLLTTQALLMAIAAGLAGFAWMGWATPPALIVFGVVNGATMAFNVPAWQVLTPRLVPREELTQAINLNGLQFNLARVVGPALAGVVMALYGPAVLFALNAISFLGVMFAVTGTPDAPAPPREPTTAWQRTREAVAFVFHRPGPRAVFLGMVVFAALAAPLVRLLSLFVRDVYPRGDWLSTLLVRVAGARGDGQAKEAAFGLLLAMMGLGAVVGVWALRLVPRWYPKHHFIPLSIACSGVSIVLFSATESFPLAALLVFLCGVFWLWAFNSAFAAMQVLVDDTMRGRVLSVCNVAVFGAMPLGSLAAGALGEVVSGRVGDGAGVQVGVGAMGALLTIVGLVMLTWRTPEVDGLAPGDRGHARRPGLLVGITGGAHRPANRDR